MHDERVLGPELREHLRDRLDQRLGVDAHHLPAGAGRVRQRPEQVEDACGCRARAGSGRRGASRGGGPGRTGSRSRPRRCRRRRRPERGRSARRAPRARRPSRTATTRPGCRAWRSTRPRPRRRSAADVEMLNVSEPSPPVPHVSTRSECVGVAGVTWARIARAQPAISSGVSPFILSATRNAAIWAGEASPDITCIIATCASSPERSRPSTSCLIALVITGRPPWRGSSRSGAARAASAPTRGETVRRAWGLSDGGRP